MKNGEREIQGSYSWGLAEMRLEPGDEVEYFMEILDIDNVQGPNKGQSETFAFTIFDSGQERENLILLQEELTEKIIENNIPAIAYTYSDPIVFYEYVMDTGKLAREKNIRNVLYWS